MSYVIALLISVFVATVALSIITTECKIRHLRRNQEQWVISEEKRFSEKLAAIGKAS